MKKRDITSAVLDENYYPSSTTFPRHLNSVEEEEEEENYYIPKRNVWKWIVGLFLLAATIVILVPIWQTALQPTNTTTSAATAPDIEASANTTGKTGGKGTPQTRPPATMAPSPSTYPFVHGIDCTPQGQVRRRHRQLHNSDGSNNNNNHGKGRSSGTLNPVKQICSTDAVVTGVIQLLNGDTVNVGPYLVDLVLAAFDSFENITITGFPSSTVSVDGQVVVNGTSVTISSLEILETLVLTPFDTKDFSLRINDRLSIPIFVLPVASEPIIEAPMGSVVDTVTFQVERSDPRDILTVELRVGTDPTGRPLGTIKALMDIPGIEFRDLGGGVYRIESTSLLQSPESIEIGINLLIGGSLSFVADTQAVPGDYAEGIHAIVTSTEADQEAQIATASVAIYQPVSMAQARPTASPVALFSITLVEDIPKQIGNDIERIVAIFLRTSDGRFRISGFPIGSMVSYSDQGYTRSIEVQTIDNVIEFSNIDDLESLVVTAPAQSDEDFMLIVVNDSVDATLEIPVFVLAVADQPSLRLNSRVVSSGGSSVPIRVYPAFGEDIDGSESLSVIFEVSFDNSTQQPIGILTLEPKLRVPGANFAQTGVGTYKAEVSHRIPLIEASILRLLLGSGSIMFTPFPGVSGVFVEGLIITVNSKENADSVEGLAPNDNPNEGTGGDTDTSIALVVAPVRVTIIDTDFSSTSQPTTQVLSDPDTAFPTAATTPMPSMHPSTMTSEFPTQIPSPETSSIFNPTASPSEPPYPLSINPTPRPSVGPTSRESEFPSIHPSISPNATPSLVPSVNPSHGKSDAPSIPPSNWPSLLPSFQSQSPTSLPSSIPTAALTSSPTISLPNVADFRMSLGATMDYTSANGTFWISDVFTTGTAVDECSTGVLIGITDRDLYCTYRQWNSATTGPLLLPAEIPGYYKVTMYFTETSALPGERVVDVFTSGSRIFTGIDIAVLTGGSGVSALDITGFSFDGSMNIEIVASSGFPVLSAIEREFVPTAVAPFEVRVNAGSASSFVDSANNTWISDNFFAGGATFSGCPAEIDGTLDDDIFCSERSGSFSYSVPIPGYGFYHVVLHFAEYFYDAVGLRVFNVLANGKIFAENVDIFNVVGNFSAYTVEATIQVSAFSLTLDFQSVIENPKISGLEIYDVTDTFASSTLINCGGSEYIDVNNRIWMADTFFTGGSAFSDHTFGIDATDDDTLFHSERNGDFTYHIPVATGTYSIILSFAELFWDTTNQRLFDIYVQSDLRAISVDIVSLAGANLTAVQMTIPDIVSLQGFISMEFVSSTPIVDRPKLSAIELVRQ